MTPEERKASLRRRQLAARQKSISGPGAEKQERGAVSRIAEQVGAGSQVGIARGLGFPVDAVTGGINGIGDVTGLWGPIENPIGGSESIDSLLRPIRQNVPEPSTRGERIGRRVGEEVGASASMAPLGMASQAVRSAPGAFAATESASALGSGLGAAAANEIAPDSAAADVVGALLGGVAGGSLASWATGANGTKAVTRGGIEDQRMRAADAYAPVRADQRTLPPNSVDDLATDLYARADAERINPRLQPGSSAILDQLIEDSAKPTRIEDVENMRRMTQRGLPATASPDDRRLAQIMTGQITDYLDNLSDPVADSLVEGRNAHRRASAAQAVDDASTKAARRAASTGSGGNEINAMRQNLRGILDNPRKSRSFTKEELSMMDEVVRGTAGQNTMRRLSRFAPSSGGLSAMLGVGGAMASPAIALPIMGATELAKHMGEKGTRSAVDALLQSIAPDRVLQAGDDGITPIIKALLAGRVMAGDE